MNLNLTKPLKKMTRSYLFLKSNNVDMIFITIQHIFPGLSLPLCKNKKIMVIYADDLIIKIKTIQNHKNKIF